MIINKKYCIGIITKDINFWNRNWVDNDGYMLTKLTKNKEYIYWLTSKYNTFRLSLYETFYDDLPTCESIYKEFHEYITTMEYTVDINIYSIYIKVKIHDIGTYRFIKLNSNNDGRNTTILDDRVDSNMYIYICDKCGIDLSDIDVHKDCYKSHCPVCKEDKNHKSYQQIRDAQIAYKLLTT
ncbi:MAG: hypothetical protein WCX82_03495 [archaeon]|jgi:rubrerythrin